MLDQLDVLAETGAAQPLEQLKRSHHRPVTRHSAAGANTPTAARGSARIATINNACNGVKLSEIDRHRFYRLRYEPGESDAEREEVAAA